MKMERVHFCIRFSTSAGLEAFVLSLERNLLWMKRDGRMSCVTAGTHRDLKMGTDDARTHCAMGADREAVDPACAALQSPRF